MTLKKLREKSGLKVNKVAEELDITRMQLYNLENGRYKIDKLKRKILAELYQTTEEEIIKASIKNEN